MTFRRPLDRASLIAVLLFLVLSMVCLFTGLGGLALILMPVPFIVWQVRQGFSMMGPMAAALTVVLVMSGFSLLVILLVPGIYFLGWAMGEALKEGKGTPPYWALISGTLVFVMLGTVILAYLRYKGVNIEASLAQEAKRSLTDYRVFLPSTNPAQLQQWSQTMAQRMQMLLPGFLITLAVLLSALNLRLAAWILRPQPMVPSLLSGWHMPTSAVWIYVLATLGVLTGKPGETSLLWQAVNNATFVAGFLFGIQGLAFLWRRIPPRRQHPLWLVPMIAPALVLGSIYILLGLVDVMVQVRKKNP
ncbi:DUF2232 domain-containing protein [Alicyclobacillaceae bacterium I2511]|nr:DUF2232 domain-containing protein [Alicyclobacillaceae bacterium I2511]